MGAGSPTISLEDELVRAVVLPSDVVVCAFVGTDLVRAATTRIAMSPTATMALGRALIGAVLLSAGTEPRQAVQLRFRGDGPLGTVLAISDSDGLARGTVQNPTADAPLRQGHFDVAAGIGQGTLVVLRNHPSWREPHTGIVRLETGEIAKDLAKYLTATEMSPAAVGLAVGLDREGVVDSAAGFLVRAHPGADDAVLADVERNVGTLPNTAELVRMGFGADRIVDHLTQGVGSGERQRSQPAHFCPCTKRRALETMTLLGADEIRGILDGGEAQEVCCHFCGEAYVMTPAELRARFADS